ncbi:MAG: hypothetical protein C0167_00420, partial [Nitrososphaera sp.]
MFALLARLQGSSGYFFRRVEFRPSDETRSQGEIYMHVWLDINRVITGGAPDYITLVGYWRDSPEKRGICLYFYDEGGNEKEKMIRYMAERGKG